MTTKNIRSVITALLLFGITLAAGAQDRQLDGTWHSAEGLELRFGNGNLELQMNHEELETGFMLMARGTFTASGGKITVTYTHYHGAFFLEVMNTTLFGIRSGGWYTLDELDIAHAQNPRLGAYGPAHAVAACPALYDGYRPHNINNSFTLEFGTFTRQ